MSEFIAVRLARIEEKLVRVEDKLDTALGTLHGTPRHGDIGLVKEVDLLKHNTISKKGLVTLVSLVASLWVVAAGVVAAVAAVFKITPS